MRSRFTLSGLPARLSSLSTGMIIAMGAGLLVPALIGVLALAHLRQTQITHELNTSLDEKAALLASSLVIPVWNYDTNGMDRIANAAMIDPKVVRITISDPNSTPIISLVRPERRQSHSIIVRRDLILTGMATGNVELAGNVEVEVDDGQIQYQFENDRRVYAFILLGQFGLSLTLILAALRLRVLKPLTALTSFSNRLASGDFEHHLDWNHHDEIGQLAHQMEQMRHDLKTSFAEQQAILNNVQVGVIFERDQTIQLANRHAERLFGYSTGAMHGLDTETIVPGQISDVHTVRRHEEELQLKRLDGSVFWASLRGGSLDGDQPHAGSIWVIEDISTRKAAEQEINSLAFYDPLTLLPNRRLLLDRLKQALLLGARTRNHGALLFIDLDNFKTLNDTLGHVIGDGLLKLVAQRLLTCVGRSDTVARLGGDEFVVILENLGAGLEDAAAQAQTVAERILASLNQPFHLSSHTRYSTPSIGITMMTCQEENVDDLLRQADMAMYQAKNAGRNTLIFFDARMQTLLLSRAALEIDMRAAIQTSQFLAYYQPKVIEQDRLTGAELLLRWQHPQRGWISPLEFIHLAEETNLIFPLGQWVIETACQQLAAWANRPDMRHLTIAVNVSAKQFRQPNFVDDVRATLAGTGANPHRLELELTESLLVEDVEGVIAKMTALKALGVGFSLDDFGTGYSSLSYLKRLPLDQLKIDQSFVRHILTDPNDAAIARMVVALAGSLGLAVIAEGVETTAQRDFLAQLGCHAFQGYLISKPLPIDQFETFCQTLAPNQQHRSTLA
jgi:diguanylate cyclase (GGDEF)-like protein/PAS domain S-box-containing protein